MQNTQTTFNSGSSAPIQSIQYHNPYYNLPVVKNPHLQEQQCKLVEEDYDGACWLDWSGWSICEGVCGQKLQTAVRRCRGGIADVSVGCGGCEIKRQPCKNSITKSATFATICPYWTFWSEWGSCIVPRPKHYCAPKYSNGSGMQRRTRTCADPTVEKTYKGDVSRCDALNQGGALEERQCTGFAPVSITPSPLYISDNIWSKCNPACGPGIQTQTEKHICADYENTWVSKDEFYKTNTRVCDTSCCRVLEWSDWLIINQDECEDQWTYKRTRQFDGNGCNQDPYLTMRRVETKIETAQPQIPCSFDNYNVAQTWGECEGRPISYMNQVTTCGVNGIQRRQCRHYCWSRNEKYRSDYYSPWEQRKCGPPATLSGPKIECKQPYCLPTDKVCTQTKGCHLTENGKNYIQIEPTMTVECPPNLFCPAPPRIPAPLCRCGQTETIGNDPCNPGGSIKNCPTLAPRCVWSEWKMRQETLMMVNNGQCICMHDLKHRESRQETCTFLAEIHLTQPNTPPCRVEAGALMYRANKHARQACYSNQQCEPCPTCYDDARPNHNIWAIKKVCKQLNLCTQQYEPVDLGLCPKPLESCCRFTQWKTVTICQDIGTLRCPSHQTVFESVERRDYLCNGIVQNDRVARGQIERTARCPRVPCPALPSFSESSWSACSGLIRGGRSDGSDLHCGGYRNQTLIYECPDEQCSNLDALYLKRLIDGRMYRVKFDVPDVKYHSSYCYRKHLEDNSGYNQYTAWMKSSQSGTICDSVNLIQNVITYKLEYTYTRQRLNLCQRNAQYQIETKTEYEPKRETCVQEYIRDSQGNVQCQYSPNRCQATVQKKCVFGGPCANSIRQNSMIETIPDFGKFCPLNEGYGAEVCTSICTPSATNPCKGTITCRRKNICHPEREEQIEHKDCCVDNYYAGGAWHPENNLPLSRPIPTTLGYRGQTVQVNCDPCGGILVKNDKKCDKCELKTFKAGTLSCPVPEWRWTEWRRETCKSCRDTFDDTCLETREKITSAGAMHCPGADRQTRNVPLPPCKEMRCCDPRYNADSKLTYRECGTIHNGETIPSEYILPCTHESDPSATCGEGRQYKMEKMCSYNILEKRFYTRGEQNYQIIPRKSVHKTQVCQLHERIEQQTYTAPDCDNQCKNKFRVINTEYICVPRLGAAIRWPFNQKPSRYNMISREEVCPTPQLPTPSDPYPYMHTYGSCEGRCGTYSTARKCTNAAGKQFPFSTTPCVCGQCCLVSKQNSNIIFESNNHIEVTTYNCPRLPNYSQTIRDEQCQCGTCNDQVCQYDGCTRQQIPGSCRSVQRADVVKRPPTTEQSDCIYAEDKCSSEPYRLYTTTTYCDLTTGKLLNPPRRTSQMIYDNIKCPAYQYEQKEVRGECISNPATDPYKCNPYRLVHEELHCNGNTPSFINNTRTHHRTTDRDCLPRTDTKWTEWSTCTANYGKPVVCGMGKQTRHEVYVCDGQRVPVCGDNMQYYSIAHQYNQRNKCSKPEERDCGCMIKRLQQIESTKSCDKCGPEIQYYHVHSRCMTQTQAIPGMAFLNDCSSCLECDEDQHTTMPFKRDEVCPIGDRVRIVQVPENCPAQPSCVQTQQQIQEYNECDKLVNTYTRQCPYSRKPKSETVSACSSYCGKGTRTRTIIDPCDQNRSFTEDCNGPYGQPVHRYGAIVETCKTEVCSSTYTVSYQRQQIDWVCSKDKTKQPNTNLAEYASFIQDTKPCGAARDMCVYWGVWSRWGSCSTSCEVTTNPGHQVRQRFCNGGNPGDKGCRGEDVNGKLNIMSTEQRQCQDQNRCCDYEWSGWSTMCCTTSKRGGAQQKKIKVNKCDTTRAPIVLEEFQPCEIMEDLQTTLSCSQVFKVKEQGWTNSWVQLINGYTHYIDGYSYRFIQTNNAWKIERNIRGQWMTYDNFEEFKNAADNIYYYRIDQTWYRMNGLTQKLTQTYKPSGWTAPIQPIVVQPAVGFSYVGGNTDRGTYTVNGQSYYFNKHSSDGGATYISWYKLESSGTQTPLVVERKFYQNKYYYSFDSGNNWYFYNSVNDKFAEYPSAPWEQRWDTTIFG